MRDVPDAAGSRAPILPTSITMPRSARNICCASRAVRRGYRRPVSHRCASSIWMETWSDTCAHMVGHGSTPDGRVITPSFASDPGKGVQDRLRHLASR
jgi:hypothetical protein